MYLAVNVWGGGSGGTLVPGLAGGGGMGGGGDGGGGDGGGTSGGGNGEGGASSPAVWVPPAGHLNCEEHVLVDANLE